jgi:hypothetical protein
MRKLLIILVALTFIACGKKGDPLPKATLGIPSPDWAELSLVDEGVLISNHSDTYGLLVERSTYDLGDLRIPTYTRMAELHPQEVYLDNSTTENTRYNYRLRAVHQQYVAYGSPVTRPISYMRRVAVEDVSTEISGGELCLEYKMSDNAVRSDVLINGMPGRLQENGCYKLPLVASLLLVIVPYTEAGTPGQAYSATLEQDLSEILLPPQNIRIIRSDKIIISWSPVQKAERYRIITGERSVIIDSNIYNHPLGRGCTSFSINSIDSAGKESEKVSVESCP